MTPQQFRKYRILFIKQKCEHCRKVIGFIERINSKLPIDKRVRVIDCTMYQDYGILNDPLIQLFSKSFDGYPTAFISGIKVSGANSRVEIETYINDLLEDDFIIGESNERRFNKDCEVSKGLFRGEVVCK